MPTAANHWFHGFKIHTLIHQPIQMVPAAMLLPESRSDQVVACAQTSSNGPADGEGHSAISRALDLPRLGGRFFTFEPTGINHASHTSAVPTEVQGSDH